MNNKITLAGLYIGAALLCCSLIFSIIISPVTINIDSIKWEVIITPALNLVGTIILAWTLFEQRKANKTQSAGLDAEKFRSNDLNKFNQVVALIEDIKVEYSAFEITGKVIGTNDIGTYKQIKALEAIRNHYSELRTLGRVKSVVFDTYDVKDKYSNFINLVLYTADNITSYPYDKNSRVILVHKFLNVVSKFDSMVDEIASATNPDDSILINIASMTIHHFSSLTYAKIKNVKDIPTELHYSSNN